MYEQTGRVAVSFEDEQQAAEALKDAKRRFPGKVQASVEESDDRGVGGAHRRQEAEGVIVGPSYAMTNEQAKHGALGMVIGAAVLGVLTAIVIIPMAMAGTVSLTSAVLIFVAALMGGGTVGVIIGGRSGGRAEMRDDDDDHPRRVVVRIDTSSPGEAAAAREVLKAYQREGSDAADGREAGRGLSREGMIQGDTDEAPSGTDERPHGPITRRPHLNG